MKVKIKGRKQSVYVMQPNDWLGRDGIVRNAAGEEVSKAGEAIDRQRYEALRKARRIVVPQRTKKAQKPAPKKRTARRRAR